MKKEKTITYKAFDMNFKCKDFQFEIGKEHKHYGNVKICESGFHSCKNPFDILSYYPLIGSKFAECEVWGKTDEHTEDSKIASEFIFIKKELSEKELNLLCVNFLINELKDLPEKASGYSSQLAASGYSSKLAASGYYSKLAASGYSSQLAASGDSSKLAASGYYSKLAASGYSSQLAASGDYSKLAASGDSSQLAASGYSSQLAASGDYSKLAASGYSSQLAASGYSSQLEITGKNSVGANIGINGKIKGIIGTWITLAEYKDNVCVCVKSAQIDGKKIKENIFYQLVDGKFTEEN
jgi:hypothetical protein